MKPLARTLLIGTALVVCAGANAAGPPPTGVVVAEVRSDRFADRVEALGTLRAKESVALTAAVTETVTAIHFDDGERVEAGQVLVEMTRGEEHALRACHAVQPAQAGFAEAPLGLMLETYAQTLKNAERVAFTVQTKYMPIGNLTGMTDEERATIAVWYAQTQQ